MITKVLPHFNNKQSKVHVDHVGLKQRNFVYKLHWFIIYILYYTNTSTSDQDKV